MHAPTQHIRYIFSKKIFLAKKKGLTMSHEVKVLCMTPANQMQNYNAHIECKIDMLFYSMHHLAVGIKPFKSSGTILELPSKLLAKNYLLFEVLFKNVKFPN